MNMQTVCFLYLVSCVFYLLSTFARIFTYVVNTIQAEVGSLTISLLIANGLISSLSLQQNGWFGNAIANLKS